MAMDHLNTQFKNQANLDSKALAFWSTIKVVVDKVNTEAKILPFLSKIQFLRVDRDKVQAQYYIPWNGHDHWCVAHATFHYQHQGKCWVASTRPTDLLDAIMRRLEWSFDIDGLLTVVCDAANKWYITQAAEIDNNRKEV